MTKKKSSILKALVSEKTIVLKWNNEQINIQKKDSPEEFKRVSKMIDSEDLDGLENDFVNIKKRIEEFTQGNFEVNLGTLKLKGDSEAMPDCIAKRLLEMESKKSDYMPLIRFWKKLQKHSQKHVREELYSFMLHNNIPLTELGDVLVEKGVKQRSGIPGLLVDFHSGKIDNSVGMVVEMPRNKVNPNRNQTCSYGLHVAAPQHVRRVWSSGIIIECIVDPRDFVAIPSDYNNTKARVCRYQVVGYAGQEPRTELSVDLKDLLESMPKQGIVKGITGKKKVNQGKKAESVVTESAAIKLIEGMTAKSIIAYVKEQTGTKIKTTVKNKKKVVKEAIEILQKHHTPLPVQDEKKGDLKKGKTLPAPEVDFKSKTAKDIQQMIKEDFKKDIGGKDPRKARILKQAVALYVEAGWVVKNAYSR